MAAYRANRPGGSPGDILAAVITDWFFRVPAIRVAEARGASEAARTWMYRFDWPEPQANHGLGACHAAEIPYVFDTSGRDDVRPLIGASPPRPSRTAPTESGSTSSPAASPGWAPYDTVTRTTGLLAEKLSPVDDPAGDERALWEGIR